MLNVINQMEKNKTEELIDGIYDEVVGELEESIEIINNREPLNLSLAKVKRIGTNFINKLDSIKSYTHFTRHLSGIFGIDFEFLVDNVKHYSVQCESYPEYDDEGGTFNDYTISENSHIEIHLVNDRVLNISTNDIDTAIDGLLPKHILESFKSNKQLIDKLTDKDIDEIREKFSVIHDELKSDTLSLHHMSSGNNILGMASKCIYMNELNGGSMDDLIDEIVKYLADIEKKYKELICDLHSIECEFDILKYVEMNSLSTRDKLPLTRDILKELIGNELFDKIQFIDREFYLKLDLQTKDLDKYVLMNDSYTSKFSDLFRNDELILTNFIVREIIYMILNDADLYIETDIFKFSKDGSIT